MPKKNFLLHLAKEIIVGDGAMGTYIYAKGIPFNRCFEELNISNPHLVRFIHKEYISAGAQFIETNTFTANRLGLKRFGLENKVKEINLAGARIAKEMAGETVYVAGSVGPLTGSKTTEELETIRPQDKYEIFAEQIIALAEGGVDVLILETFVDIEELEIAIKVTKEKTNLPVLAQMTFTERARTPRGVTVKEAVKRLHKSAVDVIGANCGFGPNSILKVVEQMAGLTKLPISAFPNAGLPQYVDGRYMYLSTPEYHAEMARKMVNAGANLVGGCCGTTPADIKAISEKIKGTRPVPRRVVLKQIVEAKLPKPLPRFPKKSQFLDKIGKETVVVCEIDPPKGLNYEKVLEGAKRLKSSGVDAITVGDSPLAILRMGNIAMAHLMEKEGIQTILHLSCRDRNLLGLQACLMEASVLGITSVLAVTGDPAKVGDQPGATSVYDLNSIGLIRLIKQMNEGKNFTGNSISRSTNFSIGCAFNPNVDDLDTQFARLRKKIEAGAQFALSQPFYEADKIEEIYHKAKKNVGDFPILLGVLPLVSSRNAEYLNSEIPGMRVPLGVIHRLRDTPEKHQKEEGIKIVKEIINRALSITPGIYVIAPFGNVQVAEELVSYVVSRKAKIPISK